MDLQSFIGAGDLYMDRLTEAGVSTGFEFVGNCTKLEIKPEGELKEQMSKGRSTYGQTLATVTLPKPAGLTLTLDQVGAETMAMAFMGDTEDINQGAGSAVDEAVTAISGKYAELSFQNIVASGFTVTNASGTVTYSGGVDYDVNYRLGSLLTLTAGTITDGQALLVDYSYSAVTGTQINGATMPTIKAKLKLDGKNFADGKPCIVTVYEVQLMPTSGIDFLSSEWASMELAGKMKTPTGMTRPFDVQLLDA